MKYYLNVCVTNINDFKSFSHEKQDESSMKYVIALNKHTRLRTTQDNIKNSHLIATLFTFELFYISRKRLIQFAPNKHLHNVSQDTFFRAQYK